MAPRYLVVAALFMLSLGNFGGFASTNAFPLLHRLTGSSATYFQAAAILNLVAIFCWQLMPAVRPRRTSGLSAEGLAEKTS